MSDPAPIKISAEEKARQLHVGKLSRHIFLCTGSSCCTPEAGMAAWEHLKNRLTELGLTKCDGAVYRTRVACLRMCNEGPIALAYPEGVWYRHADIPNLERIIDEHLVNGRVVEDLVITRDELKTSRA